MEAMDALLKSCHAQSLNLYVESFLKTVQRLLESPEPELLILASQSFLQFSQIEEDTPSYHRTYDFFVDRFSQMCHAETWEGQERIRISGLLGLNGVIRKTVNEDLAENIWDPKRMDKIIPSLLYNIHSEEDPSNLLESQTPSKMADQLLRELVKATSFSTIKAVLLPVLVHVDNHRLWEEHNQTRVVQVFEAIMYSIQPDLSYIVIDRLMGHLDTTSAPKKKSQIASVLAKIIGIGVGDSTVGPSVLEIINALLKHLKKPTVNGGGGAFYVQQYHHALLTALGEYVSRLPDFQMVEIMTFILSKVPGNEPNAASEQELLQIMLKALYCVAEKYTSKYFTTTFSPQFLSPLLRILSLPDQEIRLMVLQILQTLVDRHDNLEKLSKPSLRPANLGLNGGLSTKFSRADQMFTQKTLFHVYNTFKKVLEESNSNEVVEYMYTTVALLVMETSNSDDGTVYLLDLIVYIQNIALRNLALSSENRFALHALAISLLALLGSTVGIAELDAYVDTLIGARELRAHQMLPPFTEDYQPGLDPNTPDESLLIKEETIKEALTNAGKNLQKMDSLPRRQTSPHNYLWQSSSNGAGETGSRRASTVSVASSGLDSSSSSPGILKKPFNEEVSVAAFKKVLEGSSSKEKEEKIQKELREKYLNDSFEHILEFASEDSPPLHESLQNILNRVSLFSEAKKQSDSGEFYSIMKDPAPYEKIFPELFMY
eukprot:TRINITY_DN2958_c0_g1_i1.p1 TRINITY_DN2958_c0_g1~~TRINITY_DN2958_c0_g1_i1.p1  ORF type:complete len:787 (-),score=282.89 TRINITY_DN2958_c0_g1_i1:42-2189(-)